MSAEDQLRALQVQMQEMATAHTEMIRVNAHLTSEVNRLGAVINFGAPAQAARMAEGVDAGATSVRGDGSGGARAPQFHYGKQCCPEPYNGKNKSGFKDWMFKMGNFLAMSTVGYRHVAAVLDWSAKEQTEISEADFSTEAQSNGQGWMGSTGADHLDFSSNLWALLSNKTEGEALNCIRTVAKGNGIEAWRRLHHEYKPSTATQAMGYMTRILIQPPTKDIEQATATLHQFEENIRAYEECGEKYRLEEIVKVARLQQLMPAKVQEFVALKCPGEVDFKTMRRRIVEYLLIFTKGAAPTLDKLKGASRQDRSSRRSRGR